MTTDIINAIPVIIALVKFVVWVRVQKKPKHKKAKRKSKGLKKSHTSDKSEI